MPGERRFRANFQAGAVLSGEPSELRLSQHAHMFAKQPLSRLKFTTFEFPSRQGGRFLRILEMIGPIEDEFRVRPDMGALDAEKIAILGPLSIGCTNRQTSLICRDTVGPYSWVTR